MGAAQSVMMMLAKYVFFDNGKELLYTKMNAEEKSKGKAAIDVVGSRLGKSLSGYIHTITLFLYNTKHVTDITHILLIAFLLICLPWLYSIHYLGKVIEEKKEVPPTP